MSRVPKWKIEKAKVKVVFRLQFHATHIPQPGWDKLFVSFIPADTGKVTAKTNKVSVRNGNCKWSDPIYETTRLLLDNRTKQYEEKLYKLVVSMGSSRSSLLGEVNINLAEFADALKPSSVALPLHGCDFGTVLHVTVQLLTSKTGFREFEQQRELSVKGLQMISSQRSHDHTEVAAASSEATYGQMDKVNSRVRYKKDSIELPSLEEVGESNEDFDEDSAAGVDGSSFTSDGLYTEKNDVTANEMDSFKKTSGDLSGFPVNQSPALEKEDQQGSRLSTQGSNDWTHGWSSDYSVDHDLATAYEENNRLRVRLEVAESAFLQLKLEAKSLQRITDELGAETQSLSQQLLMELASGEQLTREVSTLRSECSKLRTDLEALKSAKIMRNSLDERTRISPAMKHDLLDYICKLGDDGDPDSRFGGLQESWLKGFLYIEEKIREIQNKTFLGYRGNDIEFLHQDFEVLGCAIENLKADIVQAPWQEESSSGNINKEGRISSLSSPHHSFQDHDSLKKNLEAPKIMEEKICNLLQTLEESNNEKGGLVKKMNQMECYYEGLILELEESQKQTLKELEILKTEHSSCLYTISALQGQIDTIHQEMNKQLICFADDRNILESQNKELEKRAIASEAALKRVRSNYSIAVDRLQKDLELLSFQVLSMYESNEILAKQDFFDASESYPKEFSERASTLTDKDDSMISLDQESDSFVTTRIQAEISPKEVNRDQFHMQNGISESASYKNSTAVCKTEVPMYVDLQIENDSYAGEFELINARKDALLDKYTQVKKNLILNANLFSERDHLSMTFDSLLLDNAVTLQSQGLYARGEKQHLTDSNDVQELKASICMMKEQFSHTEAEILEMHMLNVHLRIFSEVLQETLLDVNDSIMCMRGNVLELKQQLDNTNGIKESLMLKLDRALDDVMVLREDNANHVSTCEDLTLKNQILDAKLRDSLDENTFLTENIVEYKNLIAECRNYEDMYKACIEERNTYEKLLKQENLHNNHLQAQINSMVEEIQTLKEELDKQTLAKTDMQASVIKFQDKLRDLCASMISCNEQISCSAFGGFSLLQDLESENYMVVIMNLEQFQKEVCKSIVQLRKENQEMEEMRNSLQYSLNQAESQITFMKQKFDSDLEQITKKLNLSSSLVENLQLELEIVSEKFKISVEAEKKNASRNEELSLKLRMVEIELQQAVDQNKNLGEQLLVLENVKEELERTQISFSSCMQENKTLLMSMKLRNESSNQMENELSTLKESFRCTDEVMRIEKSLREGLETAVANLTSQLKEKDQQLLSLFEQRAEVDHLREEILDLKKANAELEHHFVYSKERRKKLEVENLSLCSEVVNVKNQLAEIIEHLLTAEIESTYMRSQFPSRVEELLVQMKTSERELDEILLKHKDDMSLLDSLTASEAQLFKENATISATLESLKSALEIVIHEKQSLLDYVNKNETTWSEFQSMKVRAEAMEEDSVRDKKKYEDGIQQLKHLLSSFEEEVESLRSCRNELEMTDIMLRSKINEQQLLLDECDNKLNMLKEENNELSYRLSEQILKTEEFRSLSVHLRELKNKADAESHQTRENREVDGTPFAIQESLRIAFIKEQYESKIQEMKNQLYVSNKYAEEMLMKLQNALDEVEIGKKSEVSLTKKVEELSIKILDLENELDTVLTDRKELLKTSDRMKAELECATLSLDCCNEEKLKIETFLKDSNEEKKKVRVELDLVRRLLNNMASTDVLTYDDNQQTGIPVITSIGQILEDGKIGFSPLCQSMPNTKGTSYEQNGVTVSCVDCKDEVKLSNMGGVFDSSILVDSVQPADVTDKSQLDSLTSPTDLQDGLGASGETLSGNNVDLAKIEEQFKEQRKLKTSMEKLYKELERLRNENLSSLPPEENFDPFLHGLEKELAQLDMANEQLGSMFPSYKDFPGSGNALERVLALELELAEALQTKKKSDIHFRSSFLKQHTDEEAVFQSFRDINELIQEMLEVKSKHATVETELKEMHTRYSQLSLQFAEVEGERQKLMMTMKHRATKK